MHRQHLAGANLRQLELKCGYKDANIKKAFERLGLEVRLDPTLGYFPKTLVRLTKPQLRELMRRQSRICVPKEIHTEWREWPMKKRAWWIKELRRLLKSPTDRPESPFSANVEPFDYSTPNARELLMAKNGGKSSHQAGCKIKVGSQGVIWNNELWFWTHNTGYVCGLPWTKERGRPLLTRAIYEQAHGPVPSGHVIRLRDGNPNNLDPSNLVLASRNSVARENQAQHFTKQSRAKTAALLKLSSHTTEHHDQFKGLLGKPGRRSRGKRQAA